MLYEDARAIKPYSNNPARNSNVIEIYHLIIGIEFALLCFVKRIGKALSEPLTNPNANKN
jgi:hypothetical protein